MGKELQRITQVNPRTGELVEADVDLSALAEQLVATATNQGIELTGPNGLLTALTRQVLQTALEVEMTDHLGYDRHDTAGRGAGTAAMGRARRRCAPRSARSPCRCRGTGSGTFEPRIVPKHQRRLDGFDQNVISLYAKGMTTGDIQAHLAEIYGDRDLPGPGLHGSPTRIVEEMAAWQTRPLEPVYPVLLIDAIVVKIRDGQVGEPAGLRGDGHQPRRANATCWACGSGRPAGRAPSTG